MVVVSVLAALVGAPEMDLCSSGSCASAAPLSCVHLSVSQGFGNTPWEHPHRGIDLVCPAGTPVRAVSAGVFHRRDDLQAPCPFFAGHFGGYGIYGVVDSSTTEVLYGHLAGYAVRDGAAVAAGAVLGYEGSTGCSTGAHLHLEVRRGGLPVNPCPWLPTGYPAAHRPDGRCWGSALP